MKLQRYLSLALLALSVGCAQLPDDQPEDDTSGTPGGSSGATLCRIQSEIFDSQCVHCHTGAGAAGALDLSSGKAYDELVNAASVQAAAMDLVEPGDSADSFLYHKVNGTYADVEGGQNGGLMPLGGSPLSADQLALIQAWIDAGAPETCESDGSPTPGSDDTAAPGSPTPGLPDGDTLCDVQTAVYTPYCVGCHNTASASAGLDLTSANAYDETVNVAASELASMKRVAPGQPQQSYLYLKLIDAHLQAGGSGSRMPQGGELPAELIGLVERWISAGATSDCGDFTPTPTPEPTPTPTPPPANLVPLCGVQQQIFNPYCTGCHGGSGGSAGLELASSKAYAELVNVRASELSTMDRIEPGDATKSYLYHKIAGTHTSVGGSGARMPEGDPALSASQLKLVEDWIVMGAPEFCEGTGEPLPDVVVIEEARGDEDGELRVRGSVTELAEGGFAGSVELFRDGLSPDGTGCTGASLGTLNVSQADGEFRYERDGLDEVPSFICIESEGGGLAEAQVEF